MLSACTRSSSNVLNGGQYTSFSHVYGWSKQNAKKTIEADASDAASTIEGSVGMADMSETSSEGSPGPTPVLIPSENAGLWYVVESCQAYAHCDSDLRLAYCYLSFASGGYVSADSVKLLLGAIKLMHLCDIEVPDICSVLAHACVYFSELYAVCGKRMSLREKGNVMVSFIYLAHTYVLDVTCPLRFWHQHLFHNYCDIATLDKAVMQMMKVRNYILRVDDHDLNRRFACLLQSVEGGVMLTA